MFGILPDTLAARPLFCFDTCQLTRGFYFLVGDGDEGLTAYVEPFVILLILVLNACVAIWQDSNADNALEALMDMQAQACKCLRDGKWQTIEAKILVPGDIV